MTRPSATGAAPATVDAVCVEITDMPGRHNYWCPTARQALAMALEHARGLGPGWTVDHDARPRPHFHVVQLARRPDGRVQHRRASGHYFYGGRRPYRIRHRDRGRGLRGELRAGPGSEPPRVASVPDLGSASPADVREYETPVSYTETGMVRSAIGRGRTDENTLTDLVFSRRYPQRNGRPISRSEPDYPRLSREWIGIRDSLVRPILRGTAGTPAPGAPVVPLPSTNRRELLREIVAFVQAKKIAFYHPNDRDGMARGTGVVRRSDGVDVAIDTQVLRAYVALVARGFTFNVSSMIGGHTRNVSGSTRVSRHWDGHAFDVNVINGMDIDTGGEPAKPETVRFMQALNDLLGTDLAPRQVICSGNGRVDPDVLRLQIGVRGVVPGHTNHVHVGY